MVLVFGGVLAALPISTLTAQTVRGVVTQPDGVTPAAGVIVLIESATSSTAATADASASPARPSAKALTDERGAFTIRLASEGMYRGRALRVGYQPTVIQPFAVNGDGTTTALRIVLTAIPVSLPAVSVRGSDVCRGRGGDGELVARVWEEARKALLASGMTDDAAPLVAEWIEYERTLDATARFVRQQRVRSTKTVTTHAFRSAPANQLAEQGYVVDAEDGTVFHAPDADVLLSDSFAAMHCFRVEPPGAEHAGQIGVGFRPVTERRRISDIEGTFWIDRASSELRSLEYRYTNLPAVTEKVAPGGRVEFLRLATGSWLINRWFIRMPQLVVTAPATIRRRGVSVTASPTTVTAVRLVGGDVSRVQRGDSALFRGSGASLEVRTTSADSVISTHNARVTLDGTDYEALTDRAGVARISPVLPGPYRLRVQTPLMDSLGIPAEPVDVNIAVSNTTVQSVALAPAMMLQRTLCSDSDLDDTSVHLRGVVVDSLGLPVSDAAVRLGWQQQISIVRDRLMWADQSVSTTSDSLGAWQVCNVPRDVGLTVRVTSGSGEGRSTLRAVPGARFAATRIVVRPVALRAVGADPRDALVVISVADSAARPIRDAQIILTVPGEAPVRMRTDSAGRIPVTRVAPGNVTVEARKVGFASGYMQVEVDQGENTIPIVLQRSITPTLATVRVMGDRTVKPKHMDFERRRERGDATASIGQDEIVRRNPASTWQLLTRVPSLQVLDSAGYIYAKSSRMSTILCWLRLSIDGIIIPGRPNLAMMPPPSEIFGIEVFAGSARQPLEFGGEGEERYCGLISVWTK